MTIQEAITKIDALKPNQYTQSEKIRWLSVLDGIVKRTIIDTHEGGEEIEWSEYNDDTALTTELLIYHPYDEVYLRWLESQIDFANQEYAKYNNGITVYNDLFTAFRNDYNRNNTPIGVKITY